MVVPCASAGQRWLKRPPEGEKKREGQRRERRGESPSLCRRRRGESERGEKHKRERALVKNELGFGWIRGDGGEDSYIPLPLQWTDPTVDRSGEGHQRLKGSRATAVPYL